jgi:hypothetical protein
MSVVSIIQHALVGQSLRGFRRSELGNDASGLQLRTNGLS